MARTRRNWDVSSARGTLSNRSIVSPYAIARMVNAASSAGRTVRRLWDRSSRGSGGSRMSTDTASGPTLYSGQAHKGYSRQYRRRRQSRRKRRRARKWLRKQKYAFNKVSGVANQKLLLNGSITGTESGTGQTYVATHLFPYNSNVAGTKETGTNDIQAIVDSMTNSIYTDDVVSTSRFNIKYGIIDMTLHNTGTAKIEVDKYVIRYNDNVEYSLLSSFLSGAEASQACLTSSAIQKVTWAIRGSTVFDLPTTLSNGYITILSKEKMFLSPGDTTNFQFKDKRGFNIKKAELSADNNYFARKKWTTTFLFIFKKVIGESVESTAQLTIGSTRSYAWFVEGETMPGTAVLSG